VLTRGAIHDTDVHMHNCTVAVDAGDERAATSGRLAPEHARILSLTAAHSRVPAADL